MDTKAITKTQIGVMSAAAGICVANIYYNQPILKDIAAAFDIPVSCAGIISVLAQAGYGLGLFFITPLGDKVNRKNLILLLHAVLVLSLIGIAVSNSFFWLCACTLIMGLLGVAAQVILPMAASLDKVNLGRTVGIIFTGMLVGILSARVISGFIAEWLNWRYVYGISAGMVAGSALFIKFTLPDVAPAFTGSYLNLLGSTVHQLRRFPLLRKTALFGALAFGIFCSFWTTLTFHLGGAPFNYGPDVIGLFGILAIGGALMAPFFGKLADKGNPSRSQAVAMIMILAGIVVVMVLPYSLPAFIITVLLIDVGVQAAQVTNVATIYTLDETAHSRINTAYMTSYFIGGAVGTFAGIECWEAGGWHVVTWQMLLWGIAALGLSAASLFKIRR
jgi:predicted MFS family arabinose efflux permease